MALLRREFLHGSTCSEVMGIQGLAKPDLLPVRIPQVKLRVKNLFDKLKKIRRIILVGAPGFEPGTSCAQGRRSRGAAYIIYEHERIGAVLDQSEIRQNEHRGT